MRVYKVIKEITIDTGNVSFTLHPGDYLKHDGEKIKTIHYHTIYGSGILHLNNRYRNMGVRIGNNLSWVPYQDCIGREVEDITIQYNRDRLINELGI